MLLSLFLFRWFRNCLLTIISDLTEYIGSYGVWLISILWMILVFVSKLFAIRMSKMLLEVFRVGLPWRVVGHDLPVQFVWGLRTPDESGKGFLNNLMGFHRSPVASKSWAMTKRLACVETKKVDASNHLSYEEKEPVGTVISYSLERNNCCLIIFGTTSIFVMHSLLDLEWRKSSTHGRVDGEFDTQLFTTFKWMFNQMQLFSDIDLICTWIDEQDWHTRHVWTYCLAEQAGQLLRTWFRWWRFE